MCHEHRSAPIISPLSFPFDPLPILSDPSPSYLRYPYSSRSLVPMVPFPLLYSIAYCFTLGYAHCPTRCPTLVDSSSRLRLLIVHAALRSFHSSDRPLLFLPDTITYPLRCLTQLPCYSQSARLITAFDSVRLSLHCRVYKTFQSRCISSV